MLNGFKGSPRLLPKCQYLLEHTQQPMLQFQVASAIQEAVVREYAEYQENDVSVFVGWLVQYCIHQTTCLPGRLLLIGRLQRYIQDAILRAAAVALKRLSMSLAFNVTPQIISLVQNLAERSSPDHTVSSLTFNIDNRKSSTSLACQNISIRTFPPKQQNTQHSISPSNNISTPKPNSIPASSNLFG